jgi:acetyl-CoA C-acetyltransferase
MAVESGAFKGEIVAVALPGRKGESVVIDTDEEPFVAPLEKLRTLRPAFQPDGGTVTAGNSSKLNDGAAAVVVMAADVAKKRGLSPLAKIVAYGQAAQAPEWFTTAPVVAIDRTLTRAGVAKGDIDLWEINEAFAVVALANNRKLGLDAARVNVNGGAVALGHPLGASGTRILVTLLYAMSARKAKRGVASLCIGGGEAVAMVVERVGEK